MGFATWIPVIAWFNMHVAELTFVDGSSMYPFLNEDKDSTLRRDFFLNYKWSPQEGLERGMVVTLRFVSLSLFRRGEPSRIGWFWARVVTFVAASMSDSNI